MYAAYPQADNSHPEVGASEVYGHSTLCLQDVVNVLGDGVLHRRETKRLLEGFIQVNATKELENTRHRVTITIYLRADERKTEKHTNVYICFVFNIVTA